MSQSVEEDTELRDLLKQTLEENGVLCKLRAQLRACVFLALDENNSKEEEQKKPLINRKVNQHQLTAEGQLVFCLVREFLEYFNLDMTISVFDPESYCGSGYKYEGRSKLIEKLGLEFDSNIDVPLLLQCIRRAKCSDISNKELTAEKDALNYVNLNETFNLSSPTVDVDKLATNKNQENIYESEKNVAGFQVILSPRSIDESDSKDSIKTEDTYEEASSLVDDCGRESSIPLIDLGKTFEGDLNEDKSDAATPKTLSNDSVVEVEAKNSFSEKLKLSPHKGEKLKSKSSFAPLTDLPPLHLSKSRDTLLLPSLYSKEFKEKTGLKEIDKLLDIDIDSLDNYEEDFMSSSELDLSQMHSKDLMSGDSSKLHSYNDKCSRSDSEKFPSKISVKQNTEELEKSEPNNICDDLDTNSKIEDE